MRSGALTCTPSPGVAVSGRRIVPGPFRVPSRPCLQEATQISTGGPSLSYTRAIGWGETIVNRDREVSGVEPWRLDITLTTRKYLYKFINSCQEGSCELNGHIFELLAGLIFR